MDSFRMQLLSARAAKVLKRGRSTWILPSHVNQRPEVWSGGNQPARPSFQSMVASVLSSQEPLEPPLIICVMMLSKRLVEEAMKDANYPSRKMISNEGGYSNLFWEGKGFYSSRWQVNFNILS